MILYPPLKQGIKVKKWYGKNTELNSLSDLLLCISQPFGVNPQDYGGVPHNGIDLVCEEGTPILASHDGEAFYYEEKDVDNNFIGYGKYVSLRDRDGGFKTEYCHLSQVVKTGQVKAGEVIGLAGTTGNSSGFHLHFTLKNPIATDPIPYLVWFNSMDKELVGRIVSKLYQTWLQDEPLAVKYWSNLIDKPEVLENLLDQKIIDIKKAVNK